MSLCYLKVATFAPEIKVADVEFNTDSIIKAVDTADREKARVLVLPALSLTGATAGELFNTDTLIRGTAEGLKKIVNATFNKNILVFVGLPFSDEGLIYNASAVISNGKVLGVVAKENLTLDEQCFFTPAPKKTKTVKIIIRR